MQLYSICAVHYICVLPSVVLEHSSAASGLQQPGGWHDSAGSPSHSLFHHLLNSQSLIHAPDLRIKSGLHGVNDPQAVPLSLLHLLILLSQLPVNLTLNLVQLQLDTQNLGFLMLQSSLMYKIKLCTFIKIRSTFI